MKIRVRILVIAICLAMLICGLSVFAADGASDGVWRIGDDGKERYYVDGNYVTGNYQIGNHTYVFAEDGEYLGPYDAYKNIGPTGVMDTQGYKDAVAARSPLVTETFDAGRKLGNTEIPAEGLEFKEITDFSANFTSGVQTVIRAGQYGSFKRSETNLAYTYHHLRDFEKYLKAYNTVKSNGDLTGSHNYMQKSGLADFVSGANGDFIVEFELGLASLPSQSFPLISFSDRSSSAVYDEGDDKVSNLDTTTVLYLNTSGYVYSPKKSEYLICKLDVNELTRISLAVHKSTNSFDIYVNGVKLLADVTLYNNTTQTPEEFRIEECRMFEVSGNDTAYNTCQFIVDNMYFYKGDQPVCLTSGVELKNGFVADGAYLRNYENGLIRPGKFYVTGEYFGQNLNGFYTVFESGTGTAFIGYRYTVTNGGVTVSSDYAAENRFEAPKAVDMNGKLFVGWNIDGTLVEPGYTKRLNSNISVDAVGVDFSLVKGAAMSTQKDASELIFAAKIAKADYDNLIALGATIEPHIITVATENVKKAHGYLAPEHLTVDGLEHPVDTVAADWLDQSENYYFYGTSVSGIEDVLKEYSAIAYLKITLPGGQVFDIYADYDADNNSRNLYHVASAAYNDRSSIRVKGAYNKLVAYNGVRTYSPYGMIKRGRIKDVLDSIIVLNTDNNSVDASGEFYNSPYEISYVSNDTGYDITLERAGQGWKAEDLKGVIVDRQMLTQDEYQISDGAVTLAVESGKIFLYEAEPIKPTVSAGKCDEYTENDFSAMFTIDGFAGSVDGQTYKINPLNTDAKVFKENDVLYLPVNVFAVSLDENAVYYEKSGIVTYYYDNDKYTFAPDSMKYKVGKEYKDLAYPTINRNGGLFISAQDAMEIYDYEKIFEDGMGLIILSNTDVALDSVEDQSLIFEYIKELMYVRPTGDKVYQDLMSYSGGQHPYLLVDGEGFADLRYYLQFDETYQSYVTKTKNEYGIGSAKFRAQPQWFRRTDGMRLLDISRDVMNKMLGWGLLYQLGVYTGEEKQMLVDRVWAEAEAIANFYDDEKSKFSWNPDHYLDTGEATYAMAIAYDWFYDAWTPEQRAQIARAIYDYGLNTTNALDGGGYSFNLGGTGNNWNGVCNGGIMSGALAIVNDTYIVNSGLQDDVITVIGASIKGIETGMWVYGPDGGYEEGPGYWSYGTTYCMVFMASLNSSCGTNYGLYYTPGFAQSAYFTTYLGNANTTWGFHDGGSGDSNPSIAAWFASISGDGNLNAVRRQGIEKGWCSSGLYDVMFFNPHIINNSITLTLDAYYSLDTIMTFRSSWDASNNIFAGLHGGDNTASHGDLDIGNFVINVNGVYLINDLGADQYNISGYFGNYRWSYYRKRTEGQNCLVMLGHGQSWNGKTGRPEYYIDANNNIVKDSANAKYIVSQGVVYEITEDKKIKKDSNGKYVEKGKIDSAIPDPKYYGQNKTAISRATAFESGVNSAYGVVDMAQAYSASKGQMLRGLYMTNNRSTVVIQDEGTFSSYQDIWWFAHSQGEITVSEDGRTAIIYRSGIYLYAEIVVDPSAPVNAKFSVMDLVSLDQAYIGDPVDSGKYTSEKEAGRSGKKLVITAENTKNFNCAVAFKVISSPAAAPEIGTIYTWTPIKDWKAE